jgi:hypothetical protein
MIYQNDSYTFTLSLTRNDTTVVSISSVQIISSLAVYTFSLVSGPYPHLGTTVVVTGTNNSGNSGSFTIAALDQLVDSIGVSVGGTFSVTNASAVTAEETGIGTIGTTPNVTIAPILQVIRLSDFTAILTVPAAMVPLDVTNQLWAYTWSIGAAVSGEYAAIVSYASDGNIFSGKFIEKIQVGDSMILGPVALASLVALNSTVAKDATVAHASDLAAINPDNSLTVLAIKASTDNLPSDPAGMTLLAPTIQDVEDVHDAILGNQSVDKTQNPAIFTLNRLDDSILAQYQLTDDSTQSSRTSI